MKKVLSLSLLFIGLIQIAQAQNIDSIVTQAATSFFASGTKVGLSVGIIKNGAVSTYHFGTTVPGKNSTPDNETIYEIGSITKTFTSMLLAQAVHEKKLDLNDDIRKYLKGSYPNLQYKGKPIRLVHLANLTSGLPDNLPEKMPAFKSKDKTAQFFEIKKIFDDYTPGQFLTDLHRVTLKREPGLTPAHSNTAAQLMGFLLENIYKSSYTDLLKKYITGPLKMESTFVAVPAALKSRSANGYNEKGTLMPEIPKSAGSGGVLTSSLPDMLKYIGHQLEEKEAQVVMAHQLRWGDLDNLGIGLNWWMKTNFDEKRKIWTSGGTFGFASYGVLYPERNFAVVLLNNQNSNGSEDGLSDLAQSIYNALYFTAEERSAEGFGFSAGLNTLLDSMNKRGFEQAVALTNELKKKDASFKLSEAELNVLGYDFLRKEEKNKALEIFKLNVSLFPQSPNTYDSLGETYETLGDKAAAILNYKRVLELEPGNTNAADHLKKLKNK